MRRMDNGENRQPSLLQRLLHHLGLAYQPENAPGPGAPRHSRYDRMRSSVSPRLDQDIDELRSRLDALEQREF